jgi:hypothetical protein
MAQVSVKPYPEIMGDGDGDEALGFLGDGTTAIQANPELSTCGFLDLVEHNGVEEAASWQTRAEEEVLGGECTPEHVALDCAACVYLANNALLHGLPDLRYTDQDGWLQLANVTGAVADVGIGKGADTAVSESSAPVEHSVFEDEFEDMSGGEVGEKHIARSKVLANDDIDTGNYSC